MLDIIFLIKRQNREKPRGNTTAFKTLQDRWYDEYRNDMQSR